MEKCQVCGKVGEDRRTLQLRYFYDLSEISPSFDVQKVILVSLPEPRFLGSGKAWEDTFFAIRTCKDCRGDFLGLLRRWTDGEFVQEKSSDPERNIPVRQNGRTVMMTREEYNQLYPGRDPITLK